MRKAIEGREYSKFIFTKVLSDTLEEIATYGEKFELKREECSNLNLSFFLNINNAPINGFDKKIIDEIESNKEKNKIAKQIILPSLISSDSDFDFHYSKIAIPNFIGKKEIRAEIINLSLENLNKEINFENKIILAKQADPGYDWLFGCNISGLITEYGGCNSHMAIRCSELGIPAAIGVGNQIFKKICKGSMVELNPNQKTIKVIL